MGSHENEELRVLQQRIQSIARVHDPLFHSVNYEEVDIKSYLEKIIIGIGSPNRVSDDRILLDLPEETIVTQKAIPLGVILHEIMGHLPFHKDIFSIAITQKKEGKIFSVKSKSGDLLKYLSGLDGELINLMAEELNATVSYSSKSLTVLFN